MYYFCDNASCLVIFAQRYQQNVPRGATRVHTMPMCFLHRLWTRNASSTRDPRALKEPFFCFDSMFVTRFRSFSRARHCIPEMYTSLYLTRTSEDIPRKSQDAPLMVFRGATRTSMFRIALADEVGAIRSIFRNSARLSLTMLLFFHATGLMIFLLRGL